MEQISRVIRTPLGLLVATVSDEALQALTFVDSPPDIPSGNSGLLDDLEAEIQGYFSGERQRFSIPVAPQGTAFQKRVWTALLEIGYGETRTYADQARHMGVPEAIRAVAAANGRNPIAIVIPCHRVIGAGGKLTGYAGGLERKRYLLDLERGQGNLIL